MRVIERKTNGSISLKYKDWLFIDEYAEKFCMSKSGVVELALHRFMQEIKNSHEDGGTV